MTANPLLQGGAVSGNFYILRIEQMDSMYLATKASRTSWGSKSKIAVIFKGQGSSIHTYILGLLRDRKIEREGDLVSTSVAVLWHPESGAMGGQRVYSVVDLLKYNYMASAMPLDIHGVCSWVLPLHCFFLDHPLCWLSQPTTLSPLYGRPPFPFSGVSMDACLSLAAHLFILILKSSEQGGIEAYIQVMVVVCPEERDIDFRGAGV